MLLFSLGLVFGPGMGGYLCQGRDERIKELGIKCHSNWGEWEQQRQGHQVAGGGIIDCAVLRG